MIWLDVIIFVPLALVCNTVFPIPFDPVLIYFASRNQGLNAVFFVITGAICAGLSGVAEARALGRLRSHLAKLPLDRLLPRWRGKRFYLLAFLFALLPFPFSMVRLAMVERQPRSIPYGLAIIGGRLPRYLGTVTLWRGLGLPAWTNALVLLTWGAFVVCKSVLVCRKNASRALEDRRAHFSCRARARTRGTFRLSQFRM